MLTASQKRQFHKEGYIVVRGVIPKVMANAARRAINHSIGDVGRGQDDLGNYRVGQYCDDLKNTSVITNLYNKTPVIPIAESLIGEGNVLPVGGAQLALRFPGSAAGDLSEPRGHLDGLGNGKNGMAKGVYRRGFTAFAVIYLADVPKPWSGNFTVWPKSHTAFAEHFQTHGHEVLKNGTPRIDMPEPPIHVTGKTGDLILAHHQLLHTGGPNASPDVRLAVIARLQHKDVKEIGKDAYTDIWREWPGIQEIL